MSGFASVQEELAHWKQAAATAQAEYVTSTFLAMASQWGGVLLNLTSLLVYTCERASIARFQVLYGMMFRF